MSSIKAFKVTADWFSDASVTLRVDLGILTPELAAEINKFWGDARARLAAEDGDEVRTVARLFGAQAIRYFMSDGGASFGPDPSTAAPRYWTQKVIDAQGEGWLSADGLGILIIAAEVDDVGYYDVDLAEEPA